jgi:hypothetical protein
LNLGNHPGPNDQARLDRSRERGQSMFRSMLLVFAIGFVVLTVVSFIVTKEVAVVFLLAFTYLGIVVCGWFGQRWLLRNLR